MDPESLCTDSQKREMGDLGILNSNDNLVPDPISEEKAEGINLELKFINFIFVKLKIIMMTTCQIEKKLREELQRCKESLSPLQ